MLQLKRSWAYQLFIIIFNTWPKFYVQKGRKSQKLMESKYMNIIIWTSTHNVLNTCTYKVSRNSVKRFKRSCANYKRTGLTDGLTDGRTDGLVKNIIPLKLCWMGYKNVPITNHSWVSRNMEKLIVTWISLNL